MATGLGKKYDFKPVKPHLKIGQVSKVKLATVVKGDPKASLLIATTSRCRAGRYSLPWIAPLYLDPYRIMLRVKQGSNQVPFFESLV